MPKAFFPGVKENYTKVPNIFFEEIVPGATGNELKAMLFIIKKTLGWNKKWDLVSRSQFINKAGISNGSLTKTLQSCIEKGWLLKFEEGPQNKTQVYYFLNEGKNRAIVEGLNMKLFSINDLAYMNEAGIIKLLEKHNLLKREEDSSGEFERNPAYKNCTPDQVRPTETVDPGGTKIVDRRGTETVDTKDNILKTKERQQQHSNLNDISDFNTGEAEEGTNDNDVVVKSRLEKNCMGKVDESSIRLKELIIKDGEEMNIPIDDYIAGQLIKVGRGDEKRIRQAVKAAAQWAEGKEVRNWYGVLIRAVADGRKPSPGHEKTSKKNGRKDKYRELYMNWGG